ncbi:hypothetical protein Tco_0932715, partial [Tanacetum coccineum]
GTSPKSYILDLSLFCMSFLSYVNLDPLISCPPSLTNSGDLRDSQLAICGHAFQRISDINKVGADSPLRYLAMASNINTLENTRLCLKLRKLIAEHPDQEKLQSKKVKMKSIGYKLN